MVLSAHASRPTAGRRKPTGAEPPSGPPGGFVLLLLPESTCECAVCYFLPSFADCTACKQGHPPTTHRRKAVCAVSLQCFFFLCAQPPSKVYREQQSRSSVWRPGKTPFGLSFFVVRVSDEDRKHVHKNGAAVPAALAFFRLFVEASYLAAPPARVKDAPLDVFSLSFHCYFYSCCTCGTH